MKNEIILSAAKQVADIIKCSIAKGLWNDKLPGVRALARELHVNHKTVSQALKIVEDWGLVSAPRGRQARRILQKPSNQRRVDDKRLLIIHPYIEATEPVDISILNIFQKKWLEHHEKVFVKAVDTVRHTKASTYLDQLINIHAADALLMMNLPLSWGKAGVKRLPCYFAGGKTPKDVETSLFAMRHKDTIRQALMELNRLGHKRVMFPLRTSQKELKKYFILNLKKLNMEDKSHRPIEEGCILVHHETPSTWQQMWQDEFPKLMPTAVVVSDNNHLLSIYGYCQQHGIRIPQDLSVLSLSHNSQALWLCPEPSMYEFPEPAAELHFREWIVNGLRPIGQKIIQLNLSGNKSISSPRLLI